MRQTTIDTVHKRTKWVPCGAATIQVLSSFVKPWHETGKSSASVSPLWQVDNIVTEPNATSTKFLLYGTRGDTEARPKWKKSSQPKGRSRGGPEQVQVRSRIQEMANSWYLVVLKINQARSSSKDGWVHVWSRVCLESSCMLGSSWILDWAREPRRRFLMTYHDSS